MKTEELEGFASIRNWRRSLQESALSRGKPFTSDSWRIRMGAMRNYVSFTGLDPDVLLAEDVGSTMKRLTGLFLWLIGQEVGDHEARSAPLTWNSACTIQAYLRGFYTHSDTVFPKRFKVPKRRRSSVSQRDIRTEIFEYDEESDTAAMNGLLQHFISNLNLRDMTIALCLLSSGADTSDLLALNMEFLRDGRGRMLTSPRIPWAGNRVKDGFPFMTFMSREATTYLKIYVEQERMDAGNDEPLFVKDDGGRLTVHAVQESFRAAAEKMGYVKSGEAHPFRPKRLRHLFRTACAHAHIDPGYTHSMMGHSTDISASYLEKGQGLFLKEYLRVETYLTVSGVDSTKFTEVTEKFEDLSSEFSEVKEELSKSDRILKRLYDEHTELKDSVKNLERDVAALSEERDANHRHMDEANILLYAMGVDLEDVEEWDLPSIIRRLDKRGLIRRKRAPSMD